MISIHAPAKGATRTCFPNGSYFAYFNPRSREGSDGKRLQNSSLSCVISIHAPAKGATTMSTYSINFKSFQSTLPRRERLCFKEVCSRNKVYFNPRSREGSDSTPERICQRRNHFNPRSREGSDARLYFVHGIIIHDFNPRSREGSDYDII